MLGGYPPKNRIGLLMFLSAQLYNLGQGALDGCGVALPDERRRSVLQGVGGDAVISG
jgi:hypothetical protein